MRAVAPTEMRRRCSPIPTWRRDSRRSISRWSRRARDDPGDGRGANAAGDPRHARLRHRRHAARQCRPARRCAVRRRRPSIRARSSMARFTRDRGVRRRRRPRGVDARRCSTSSNGSAASGSPTPRSTGRPRRARPMPTPSMRAGTRARTATSPTSTSIMLLARHRGARRPTTSTTLSTSRRSTVRLPATVAYGSSSGSTHAAAQILVVVPDRRGRGRPRRVGVRRPGGDGARPRRSIRPSRRGDRGALMEAPEPVEETSVGAARRGGRRRIHRAGARSSSTTVCGCR